MARASQRQGEPARGPGRLGRLLESLRPATAPSRDPGRGPAVCPHCWGVNPGAFRLCARCGASMESLLQESGGLRRTAAVQSPMPQSARLSPFQRLVVGAFLVALALAYLAHLLPVAARADVEVPAPGAPAS